MDNKIDLTNALKSELGNLIFENIKLNAIIEQLNNEVSELKKESLLDTKEG
jgi:hypothetical protein